MMNNKHLRTLLRLNSQMNHPDSYQKEVATDGQLVCLWGGKNQGNNMEQLIQFIKELNTPLPS